MAYLLKRKQFGLCILGIAIGLTHLPIMAQSRGTVYLGPFLSVIWYEPSKRPYITIGELGPFHFKQSGQSEQIAVEGLDMDIVYRVKVHFNGKVVESWNLDFKKMGSDKVCIRRDKGAWRMEPFEKGKCAEARQ